MKNNKLYILVFLSVLTGALISCEDLDQVPETSYPSAAVFTTPVRVDQQVTGLYDAVKDGNFLGSRFLVYSDIRGEEFTNRLSNGVTGLQTWNFTTVESTNEVNNTWIAAYQGINQVNTFLQGLDDNAALFVQPVFPATFATTADAYRGEARFLRAISYYYLLQLYARPYTENNGASDGLPLRLNAERNFENNNLARSTVAQVYQQIIADLDFAEQKLPLTGSTNRAHRNAAIAFKTRVYLSMGNWDKVIEEANKIVTAGAPFSAPTGTKHQLVATYASIFATPYSTAESIFSFPFTTLDAPGTQNQLGYYYMPAVSSSSTPIPMVNGGNGEYPLNEKRPAIFKDSASWAGNDSRRGLTSLVYTKNSSGVTTDTTYYLTKFSSASPYTDSSPIIRYAEVLLNLSEAITRSTETVDSRAVALLNAVRGRSNGSTFVEGDFAAYTDLINTLLKERRIEFLGEGLRSIDVMRLSLPFSKKGSVAAVNPSDPNYIWPMPSSELNVNTLLTHN